MSKRLRGVAVLALVVAIGGGAAGAHVGHGSGGPTSAAGRSWSAMPAPVLQS